MTSEEIEEEKKRNIAPKKARQSLLQVPRQWVNDDDFILHNMPKEKFERRLRDETPVFRWFEVNNPDRGGEAKYGQGLKDDLDMNGTHVIQMQITTSPDFAEGVCRVLTIHYVHADLKTEPATIQYSQLWDEYFRECKDVHFSIYLKSAGLEKFEMPATPPMSDEEDEEMRFDTVEREEEPVLSFNFNFTPAPSGSRFNFTSISSGPTFTPTSSGVNENNSTPSVPSFTRTSSTMSGKKDLDEKKPQKKYLSPAKKKPSNKQKPPKKRHSIKRKKSKIEYRVEMILEDRFNEELQRQEWLVKWEGYTVEEATWEPLENVDENVKFADYMDAL